MNRTILLSLPALSLLLTANLAKAQSTNAQVIIGASNEDYATEETLTIPGFFSKESTTPFSEGLTAVASAGGERTFSGMDHNGDTQTMTFRASGQGSADYNRLRTYNSLVVENAFYNEANAPFYNSQTEELNEDGVPDYFDDFARAQWTDILQYGNTLPGYQARYLFRVHGFTQGAAEMGSTVNFASQGRNEPFNFRYDASTNPVEHTEIVASTYYPASGSTPQEFTVQFATFISGRTQRFDDGATISGETDFLSTTTLERIEMIDAAGNPVFDWTVTSASGTVYPQAVPEPASFAAFGLGAAVLLRRRRR